MKKIIFRLISLFLIFSFTMLDCFAYFKADGVITHDEVIHSKVQSLCDDGSSGNKVTVLNSFYNISQSDKKIYIGLNADFGGVEIRSDQSFKVIVSIENKPDIVFSSDGNLEFDEFNFDVEAKDKIMYSSFKTEFEIIYKFPIPDNPKILVQIIDTDGLNSKIFDIDTYIPPETTTCEEETKKEKETKPDSSKKKKSSASGKKTAKKSSSNKKDDETELLKETYNYNHSSSDMVLDSNIEKESKESESQKMIFIAASIGLLVAIVATMIFINIKYLVAKSKEDKDKKNNKK